MVIVLMGPAGAGKTTVGTALAESLGWQFVDADDLHSPENLARLAHGESLTDAERAPWLSSLREIIERAIRHDVTVDGERPPAELVAEIRRAFGR